jgi:hypothetical protein
MSVITNLDDGHIGLLRLVLPRLEQHGAPLQHKVPETIRRNPATKSSEKATGKYSRERK